MSKLNRWIASLTLVALFAAGGIALAGGFGTASAGQGVCPATADGALCEAYADGEAAAICDESGSEICAGNALECEQAAGTCRGLSANRPRSSFGANCGEGARRGVGVCRGGSF